MEKCKVWGIHKMEVGHICLESLICVSVFHRETLSLTIHVNETSCLGPNTLTI